MIIKSRIEDKRALTLVEVAQYIGVGYESLRTSVLQGKFNVIPLPITSKRKLYLREAVDVWLRKNSGVYNEDDSDDIMELLDA